MITLHNPPKMLHRKILGMLVLLAVTPLADAEACKHDGTARCLNQPARSEVGITDTLPASELSKLNDKDILSISTTGGITKIKFKNGDSAIAKDENHIERSKRSRNADYDEIFSKVEIEPSYPGGRDAWMHYLIRTFRYPMEAQKQRVQGTVVVQFIVDKKGRLGNFEVVSGPTKGGIKEEAIRVIKGSGKWIPAMQNGSIVKAYKKQVITFRLEDH